MTALCYATSTPLTAPVPVPETRLAGWPGVAAQLRRRGVQLDRSQGETLDQYENRMGTRLMALYRDSRETDCFEALYSFARPAVLHWIRGLLSRGLAHLDPTELLQDTFVNVYRYPSAFREDHAGSFRVWVRTIAGNIVRRASSPRARLSFQELPEGLQEPEDLSGNPAATAMEEEQEARLRRAWLLFLAHYSRAWEDLAQRDRRALHLVEVEGLSYQEAGRILQVGRSNMKMIVFRSRKRIARRMRLAMNAALFRPRRELGAA
jgi:RNA polymerase sigma-70 factor (ECF subfamily)